LAVLADLSYIARIWQFIAMAAPNHPIPQKTEGYTHVAQSHRADEENC
jgi:hypothetical protein